MMIPGCEIFDRQLSHQNGLNIIRIFTKEFLESLWEYLVGKTFATKSQIPEFLPYSHITSMTVVTYTHFQSIGEMGIGKFLELVDLKIQQMRDTVWKEQDACYLSNIIWGDITHTWVYMHAHQYT